MTVNHRMIDSTTDEQETIVTMTPDEHAAAAERRLELANTLQIPIEARMAHLAAGQVHATLSLRQRPSAGTINIGPGAVNIEGGFDEFKRGWSGPAHHVETAAQRRERMFGPFEPVDTQPFVDQMRAHISKLVGEIKDENIEPGFNGIWGVGDSVTWTGYGNARLVLRRRHGGLWEFEEAGEKRDNTWDDATVTKLARGEFKRYGWIVKTVRAQRRPWRGSGQWQTGDKIVWRSSIAAPDEHSATFDGTVWRSSCCGDDSVDQNASALMNVVTGRHPHCTLVRLALVGVSHDAAYVRSLGG